MAGKRRRTSELRFSRGRSSFLFIKRGPKVYTGAVSVLRMAYQPADMLMAAVFDPLPSSAPRRHHHHRRRRRLLFEIYYTLGGGWWRLYERARCSPLDRPLNVCMHVQLRMV